MSHLLDLLTGQKLKRIKKWKRDIYHYITHHYIYMNRKIETLFSFGGSDYNAQPATTQAGYFDYNLNKWMELKSFNDDMMLVFIMINERMLFI